MPTITDHVYQAAVRDIANIPDCDTDEHLRRVAKITAGWTAEDALRALKDADRLLGARIAVRETLRDAYHEMAEAMQPFGSSTTVGQVFALHASAPTAATQRVRKAIGALNLHLSAARALGIEDEDASA